jgi:hypothetical protein
MKALMRFLTPLLPALALTFLSASASALSLSTYGITDSGVGPAFGFSFSTADTYQSGTFFGSRNLGTSGPLFSQFYGDGSDQRGQPAQIGFFSSADSYEINAASVTAKVLNGSLQSITGSYFILTTGLSSGLGYYNRRVQYTFSGLGYSTTDEYLPLDGSNPNNVYTKLESVGHFSFAAAPVPEPSTYALMLAGLAVVGGVARHRRRDRSASRS